jgi:hypothetical protein
MSDFKTDMNVQSFNFTPYTLTDNVSPSEIYVGVSLNGNNEDANNWQIKFICQNGTVWYSLFPDGNQSFKFAWSCRSGYTYQ